MTRLCAIISLINIITCLNLVVIFLSKQTKYKNYIFFNLTLLFWSVFYFLWQLSSTADTALMNIKLFVISTVIIPYFYFSFIVTYTKLKKNLKVTLVKGLNLIGMSIFIPLVWNTNLIISHLQPMFIYPFWPIAGKYFPALVAFFIVNALLGLGILLRDYIKTKEKGDLYVLISTLVGFIGIGTNVFFWYEVPIPPFGNFMISFYALFLAYAITKHRILDTTYVITRTISSIITIFIFGVIYTALFLVHRTYFTDEINYLFLTWTLIYIAIIGFYFQFVRRHFQTSANKMFVKFDYDFNDVISKFNYFLAEASSLQWMIGYSEKIFKDEIGITRVKTFVPKDYGEKTETYDIYELWDLEEQQTNRHIALDKDSQIFSEIKYEKKIIHINQASKELREEMKNYGAVICLPCVRMNILEGILLLSKKDSQEQFNPKDIELLKNIAVQIATAFHRNKPFELMKRDYDRSREMAEEMSKQASYANVTRGIAHEIRNPLGMMRAGAELVLDYINDTEEVKEFAQSIIENVDRLTNITETMLKYGKPKTTATGKVSVNKIVEDILLLGKSRFKHDDIKIHNKLTEIPEVQGDSNRLYQCYLNIMLNAVQSMKGKSGELTLASRTATFQNKEGLSKAGVVLAITDTGCGISEENRKQIFDPFFTTKYENTGIGLSLVLQIIDDHTGMIDIKSEEEKGTTFEIYLPQE